MSLRFIERGREMIARLIPGRTSPELPSPTEAIESAESLVKINNDLSRLYRGYIEDWKSIGPGTSIEERQRRLYNITHFPQIAASIEKNARQNSP